MKMHEAKDAMFGHVEGLRPVDCDVVWPDKPGNIPPNSNWIRPTIRHADGRQGSLAGEDGQRRWSRKGVLIVQCFAPVGDGEYGAEVLAQTFVDGFERIRNSPIWYRNIRAIEAGKDGASVQVNVMADFEYDDFH